jgi:hypothetical protein
VKHDFSCFGPLSPKEGAISSKDFAIFHQAEDDFAKRGSPEPPAAHGAAGLKAYFSR